MKKIVSYFLIVVFTNAALVAQPLKNGIPTVAFHTDTLLSNIYALAKKENKLVFIYVTAKWCGPCRELEQALSKNDSLIAFMNSKFINVKWDMDTVQIANELRKKFYYGVPAFFSFYQMDSLLYSFSGYTNIKDFANSLSLAISPQKDITYLLQIKYDTTSNPSTQFLFDYVQAMHKQRKRKLAEKAFNKLWSIMPDSEKLSVSIGNYVITETSHLVKEYYEFILKNKDYYQTVLKKESLAKYLISPIKYGLDTIIDKRKKTTYFLHYSKSIKKM